MEGFRKAQQQGAQGFAKAGGSGGSSGGPNMNGALGGGAGIILLVAAGIGINSSLFNGQYREGVERWKRSAVQPTLEDREGMESDQRSDYEAEVMEMKSY